MLLVSLVCSLILSHYKLLWVDEVLEFYTDSKPTIAAIIFGQLHYPFSLEPPAFHLLLHFVDKLLPASPKFASRSVSIFSLLVTEICAFRITFRLTRHQGAALVALTLPFFFVTFDYAPEARLYSLLTALFALALLAYQSAIESDRRLWALVTLFASLSAAILIHYYAIFLPLPLVAAEIVRSFRRRRIDWPLLSVFVAAWAMFAFNLPFLAPLHQIQAHYYNSGDTRQMMIPFTYAWFIAHFSIYYYFPHFGYRIDRVIYFCVNVAAATLLLAVFLLRRQDWKRPSALAMLVALAGGFVLPAINVIFAHYISHAYVPRYSLPAVVSLSVFCGLLLVPLLRDKRVVFPVLACLLAACCVYACHQILVHRQETEAARAELVFTPELQSAIAAQPDHHIYIQGTAHFLTTYFYVPAALRPYLVHPDSEQRELRWMHRNTDDLLSHNLALTTDLPIIPYETLEREGGPHLFVIYHDPVEEWISEDLAARGDRVVPLGKALGGTLYRVTFREP